jgi:hypothetical protein
MGVVFVHQPVEDPLSCVPLLGRRVQIRPQDPVDQRLVWIKPRFTAPVLSRGSGHLPSRARRKVRQVTLCLRCSARCDVPP